jgi:hypothetical protein
MRGRATRLCPWIIAGTVLAGALAARDARAEIIAYETDRWTLSFDGRTAGFYSYEYGDAAPHYTAAQIAANGGQVPSMTGALVWTGYTTLADQDPNMCSMNGIANGQPCTFATSRVHSGFVGNIFGFTAKRRISPSLTAIGRIALWWPIETDQYRGFSSMSPDPRESYAKLEGPWGGLLVGRTLGLHDRGGTLTDYLYADGYSIGSPCNATQQGPLCGFIGYGYQFPGYNAGILYNTPLAGGFQLTVGIYDPVRVGLQNVLLASLPYPRVESEATYTHDSGPVFVTLYVNGMWQQATGFVPDPVTSANVKTTVNARGVSYGGRLQVGGLKIGVGGNYDIGGGDLSGLVGPVPIDDRGKLRRVTGAMGQLMYSFATVDVSAGAGVTQVEQTDSDVADQNSVIKSRLGEQLSVNYHLDATVVLNAQYFYAQHIFWRGQIQTLTDFHAGMTFTW